ncbi:MAG TPA: c-type cytochrome [Chitinophaga sp.]|uniref:c-type cytochrome n=1 Tax=Chitinophaga sp. TaxID=1869181 RepID=UPI002D1264F9|nr:c-type cytochrome [Chitinophaga sp.]HVI43979.1 c-type cytochrome [Chitinophaga sp.]
MKIDWLPVSLFLVSGVVVLKEYVSWRSEKKKNDETFAAYLATEPSDSLWYGCGSVQIPTADEKGKLIYYGYELISNTAHYLGPSGKVAQISNGMNCQNCHLQGGTIPFGNNFGKVFATYPQFRPRCNQVQQICDRVTDCFERSLNGKAPARDSREMKAICAYIKWLGNDVPAGTKPRGTSIMKLSYLDRAALPDAGREVYMNKCSSCHGNDGRGVVAVNGNGYTYPPLWGEHSYNDGAGLHRLSNFAGFVMNNMPLGTTWHKPVLTVEEAWDVAAFVNTQPRPHRDQGSDWKDIAKKPVDFPYGPYADTFSERQHKYGPFTAIKAARQQQVK